MNIRIAATIAVVASCGGIVCGGDFAIARRGMPADCAVVVSEKASPSVRFAAQELCDCVRRMTGVTLKQATDAETLSGKAVLIGQTAWSGEFAGNGLDALGDEGFRIAVKGNRLHVLGSDVRGALYGVYELLERFGGCGWFSPNCTVVPEVDAFAVPEDFDETQTPAFTLRTTDWGIVGKNPEFAAHLRINGATNPAIPQERGGSALRFCKGAGIGHTFQNLLPSEIWFESHPEYFCEVDGRRRSGREIQPCLTNPDVLRIMVSNVLERLTADPSANVVGVSQNDNRMYCRCAKCRAVDEEEGGPTGSLLRFVNAVAAEVEKVRPDVLVETLIFQYSRKPPKVTRPRRNVMPCLCAIEIGHAVPFADRAFKADSLYMDDLEQWGRISDHLLIWDYSTNYHNFLYSFPTEHTFAPNLRTYLANGVKYMFMEGASSFHCDFEELKSWLIAKLMWNPEQDEKALLDRFFAGYYGAAAPFVREYYERLRREAIAHPKERLGIFDANPPSWYTADLAAWAKGLFAQAEAAVKDDPVRYKNVRYAELVPIVTELDRYAASARSIFASRTPGSHVAPKELRDDWKRVIDTMAFTKKHGHPMRLAAGLCWEPCKLVEWKRIYGREVEPEPSEGAIVPSKDLFIISGRHAKLFKDDECVGGKALAFLPSSGKPMARLEFSKVVFDEGVPYRVRFRAKVVRDGGNGAAFRATLAKKGANPVAITNLGEAQVLGKGGEAIERNVDEVEVGYVWYEFHPTVLNDRMVFEFGSGPWERGGGIGATKEVRLDRVEIFRADAKDLPSDISRDLVIYGSTPAAIAAAVQAKRMGVSAVIVSPETRIGGLTTGGLGQTDIGNKAAFGGIALEFYKAVAAYYADGANWTRQKPETYFPDGQCAGSKGKESMWTFEPSAALKILEGWEKRDGLDIRRGEWLDREKGVVREGGKIVSIRTLTGNVYRGKVFVDATYEGDLMAAAGVSYTVGREANSVYGETISGIQRALMRNHQLVLGIDPYVKEGDPSSGLLPGVEKDCPEPDGSGDRRVQAYCFRMCLTDDPENRIPFAKPDGYEERDYELLFRNLAIAPLDRNGMPWINSRMPNRKTDTNNRTGFSTDFIGGNWNYPEASYAERERIRAAHLKYQRGLMWTLANHPRVPEKIRKEVSKWGTCKDEFRDGLGAGWQKQLYVREARRMVGEYVMTEHECRGERVAQRPIAFGAYGMDSHNCRRYVDAQGFVRNEGNIEDYNVNPPGSDKPFKRFSPYPIDYGAIVPKRGECENLFVPVCLSASHMAFGSIRMEPVFFALGQVAGTAASIAAEKGLSVQDVPYADLSARLRADGQVLELPSPAHP